MSCSQSNEVNLAITGKLISSSVKSFALSKRFTQIMVKSSLLNIMCQRLLVDQSDLKTKQYGPIPFYVFKDSTKLKHPIFHSYMKWLEGIRESIDKNYLKEIFLFLKNPQSNEILEHYTFKLTYNLGDETEYRPSLKYVKGDVVALYQMINGLGEHEKLEANTVVQLEFAYRDETPFDYEPPGFEASLQSDSVKITQFGTRLGIINTGFHKLSCFGNAQLVQQDKNPDGVTKNDVVIKPTNVDTSGGVNRVEDEEQDAPANINIVVEPMTSSRIHSKRKITVLGNVQVKEKEEVSKFQKKEKERMNISNVTVSDICAIISIESDDSINSGCICHLNKDLDVDMLTCTNCKTDVHAVCYGYLEVSEALQEGFRCVHCDTTAVKLRSYKKKECLEMAQIRLALYFVKKDGQFNANIMNAFSQSVRDECYEKLKIFRPDQTIDEEKLEVFVDMFFEQFGDSNFLV